MRRAEVVLRAMKFAERSMAAFPRGAAAVLQLSVDMERGGETPLTAEDWLLFYSAGRKRAVPHLADGQSDAEQLARVDDGIVRYVSSMRGRALSGRRKQERAVRADNARQMRRGGMKGIR
jgi:hypothetical protein